MKVEKDGKKFKMVCFKTPWIFDNTLRELGAEMSLFDVT